jgi:uncharacterized protein
VSGIGEKLAENIVLYRSENGPFENRKQLKSTAFGRKAYQQGVAFIRISNAKTQITLRYIQKLMELSKNGQRFESDSK